MYQLVIFDWDGTLMDSAAKISNCMRAAASDVGLAVPSVDDAKNVIGLGLMEAVSTLFPVASSSQLDSLIEAYRYQFLVADDTQQGLFDGVEEGLKQLNETGVFLAVATGKARAGLDRIIKSCGLQDYFTITRCADETRSKPHPQMLHEILDFTAIKANKAVMIGDTSFDLDMARNAHIDSLGVAYGVHSVDVLENSGAIEVKQDFKAVLAWLLDNRVETAFNEHENFN